MNNVSNINTFGRPSGLTLKNPGVELISVSSKRCFRTKRCFRERLGNSRMRQKCVRNASDMLQKCVKMGLVLLGKEERPKCVRNPPKLRQKCVKNARNTFGGEHLLDDTENLPDYEYLLTFRIIYRIGFE